MCLLVLMYLRDVSDLVLCMHAKSLQSCLTLCNLVDCRAYQAPLSVRFCRQEYWSGLPCPPPGDLPNPRIEPRSPTLQADSLQSEPPGKPLAPMHIVKWLKTMQIHYLTTLEVRTLKKV